MEPNTNHSDYFKPNHPLIKWHDYMCWPIAELILLLSPEYKEIYLKYSQMKESELKEKIIKYLSLYQIEPSIITETSNSEINPSTNSENSIREIIQYMKKISNFILKLYSLKPETKGNWAIDLNCLDNTGFNLWRNFAFGKYLENFRNENININDPSKSNSYLFDRNIFTFSLRVMDILSPNIFPTLRRLNKIQILKELNGDSEINKVLFNPIIPIEFIDVTIDLNDTFKGKEEKIIEKYLDTLKLHYGNDLDYNKIHPMTAINGNLLFFNQDFLDNSSNILITLNYDNQKYYLTGQAHDNAIHAVCYLPKYSNGELLGILKIDSYNKGNEFYFIDKKNEIDEILQGELCEMNMFKYTRADYLEKYKDTYCFNQIIISKIIYPKYFL